MWKKANGGKGHIDVQVVHDDFILAEGTTLGYAMGNKGAHPSLKRNIFLPVMYLFKVNEGHPLQITSFNRSMKIFPPNDFRMPMKVYEDREAYDMSALFLLPYDFEAKPGEKGFKKISGLEGTFMKGGSPSGPSSLVYAPYDAMIGFHDSLRVSHVMPSQVPDHVYDWLSRAQEIHSYERTFDQKLEGRIVIPGDEARRCALDVARMLGERYETPLRHEHITVGSKVVYT